MLPHPLKLDYEKMNTLTLKLQKVENLAELQEIRKLGHRIPTEIGLSKNKCQLTP